jgi:hypothetical protein
MKMAACGKLSYLFGSTFSYDTLALVSEAYILAGSVQALVAAYFATAVSYDCKVFKTVAFVSML